MSDSHNHDDHHGGHVGHGRSGDLDQTALDPGQKALSDALRWLFVALKVVMIGVIGMFFLGGFYRVEPNERAVVLRFGRLRGAAAQAIKKPGLRWGWPYIDEVVKAPAASKVAKLPVDTFWYWQSEQAKLGLKQDRIEQTLQFKRGDGYSLTASRGVARASREGAGDDVGVIVSEAEVSGTDYNLVHSRWQITWSVSDPLAFVEQLWDGREATSERPNRWYAVENLLVNVLEDAVIVVSANRDIEWIIWDSQKQFELDVEGRMTKRLKSLNVGLQAELYLIDVTTPRQVKGAFDAASRARSDAQERKTIAGGEASEIINEAQAQSDIIIAEAEAYRRKIVQAARGDAEYLDEVLGRIREAVDQRVPATTANYEDRWQETYGELLSQTIDQKYQEMLRAVIGGAEETFVLTVQEGGEVEWRPSLSRDAKIRKRQMREE